MTWLNFNQFHRLTMSSSLDECQTVLSARFESARCNESTYAAAVAIAVNSMQLKTTNKYSNTTSIKLLASRILKWKRL